MNAKISKVWVFAVPIVLWVIAVALIAWGWPSIELENKGQFGDSFGSLNTLFSGLAFAGVVVAILQQREELADTKSMVTQQNFDSVFFKMIDLHHEIVNATNYGGQSGRLGLSAIYSAFTNTRNQMSQGNDVSIQELKSIYRAFYNSNALYIAHYFRNLYRIVKFINESKIEDKKGYSGILRAQLSRDELRLLFYNGLGDEGDKFKPLIETYALLEHLSYRDLFRETDWQFYVRSAFGTQQIP